jgi:hypothetical protein
MAYGDEASIRFKCGNLGDQMPQDRVTDANANATARVDNETGRDPGEWSPADGDDWLNIKLATEYYAAAELKSGIQGYEKSREDDIAEAQALIKNVVGSEAGTVESSPYFVEASEYGTYPLNPTVPAYPWNLYAGGMEMETSELD